MGWDKGVGVLGGDEYRGGFYQHDTAPCFGGVGVGPIDLRAMLLATLGGIFDGMCIMILHEAYIPLIQSHSLLQ